MKKLAEIQKKLNAPKNQRNSFGGYNYRSAEDILEAVKPLLDGAILTIQDDIVLVGDRFYVKATATFTDGEYTTSTTAFAREPQTKKGMDESQITGTASSYARKYALNGLFCIDDNKDPDTDEYTKQTKKETSAPAPKVEPAEKPSIESIKQAIKDKMTLANAQAMFDKASSLYPMGSWVKEWMDKKAELEGL